MVQSLIIIFLFIFLSCKSEEKPLPIGTPMRILGVDTTGDGNKDSFGYYLLSKGNRRIVYQEIDKNGDGSADEFIWVGSSIQRQPNAILNEPIKVYEESDSNNNGKIDTIRWFLPNEYISMEIVDSDEDGFFETTIYYSYQKVPVRREIDSNKDGYADIYIWEGRAEIDSNFDKEPDLFVIGSSNLELEDKAINRRDTKPLPKSSSWFLNPKLIPLNQRAIIGSGTFVE